MSGLFTKECSYPVTNADIDSLHIRFRFLNFFIGKSKKCFRQKNWILAPTSFRNLYLDVAFIYVISSFFVDKIALNFLKVKLQEKSF